ncbi:MAG: hypothetical protein HYX73_08500 [Acidobacteria bacterium]|nr:hypothetical protein [Acidobacteriota bacterium]
MNLKKGEIWICKEPNCAAEIEVLRGANATCQGNSTVRCCCGKEMTLKAPVGKTETSEPAMAGRTGTK